MSDVTVNAGIVNVETEPLNAGVQLVKILEKFDWKPKRRWEATDRWQTLTTIFESGNIQTRSKGRSPRIFVLEFEKQNMFKTDAQEIIDFFNAHKGKHLPFRWNYKLADGSIEELVVKFNQDDLPRLINTDLVYTFQIEFVEQFEWIL